MSVMQRIITIAICSLGTMLCRFLPFVAFSSKRPTPRYIVYLGRALPLAVFAMLTVYCFKDTSAVSFSTTLARLIATAAVVAVHLYKRNMLLSIFAGVAIYMLLVQAIFV
ncbi:MAG: AzlD domain-containing protein [Clostridia bacterium]|nr:AzlD domain-containing protein [Clostridia bacterium]